MKVRFSTSLPMNYYFRVDRTPEGRFVFIIMSGNGWEMMRSSRSYSAQAHAVNRCFQIAPTLPIYDTQYRPLQPLIARVVQAA